VGVYRKHVFVCTTGKTCPGQGAQEVRDNLKAMVKSAGLDIRVNNCGCLGLCGAGPNVVIYSEGTWYTGVNADDVPEIYESLISGQPVTRLLSSVHHPE